MKIKLKITEDELLTLQEELPRRVMTSRFPSECEILVDVIPENVKDKVELDIQISGGDDVKYSVTFPVMGYRHGYAEFKNDGKTDGFAWFHPGDAEYNGENYQYATNCIGALIRFFSLMQDIPRDVPDGTEYRFDAEKWEFVPKT